MADLIKLVDLYDAATALSIFANVVLWRRITAHWDDAKEREKNSIVIGRDEFLKIIQDYQSFTAKTRVALEQLAEIVKARP